MVYHNLAQTCHENKLYDRAIPLFEQAIEIWGREPEVHIQSIKNSHFCLGLTYLSIGSRAEGIKHLQAGCDILPDDEQTQFYQSMLMTLLTENQAAFETKRAAATGRLFDRSVENAAIDAMDMGVQAMTAGVKQRDPNQFETTSLHGGTPSRHSAMCVKQRASEMDRTPRSIAQSSHRYSAACCHFRRASRFSG